MIFYSDATEQARFDAAGDFGIGTNGEPYHPLTLLRDGSSPTLSLDRSGIGTFHLGVASDGSGVIATNDATGSGPQNISIRTGVTYNNDITSTGYELLKIRQDGNLGLNVTNPLGKLHIGHSGDGYKISNLISPPPGTFYMNGGNSTSSDAGQIIIGDNLLNWKLHIGAVDPLESTYYDIMTIKTGSGAQSSQVNIADYLNVSNFVFADSDSLGVGMSPLPGTYAFQIKPSTNAMNVSGVLYVDGTSGRVGIGTSTPTHTLNVVGSANITENLTVTDKIGIGIDPTGAYQMHIDTANNFISGTSQSGANGRFAMQYTTAGGINRFRYDSAGIVDVSLGTVIFPDAVFVDNSNGFVGIGIMTPTTTLMINSSGTNGVDIGANSANKENSGELFFSNGTSGKSFGIVKTGSRLGFAYGATPGSGSGTPIMYMTELGNVGIGPLLLNPNARLEISKGGYLGEGIFELNVSGVLYVNATQQALTLIGNQTMSGAITTGQGANPVVNAWNHFGTGGKDNANIADVNDVYISDDLEVDGTAFIPATGGTSGAYWTVGDVAENMLTIEGRNSLLCKNNSKYCTGKPYNHGELDFGDVACIDPRYGQVIMKCKNSETDIPVGVVSSTASMIIGGDADYETGYPVGVAGFVPTKVSNENGGIYPGDLLVLSATKPGYAMKQMGIKNYSGMIIGSAYDFCDGRYNEECKIPVLIALSYTKDFQEEINILKEQYKRFNSFFEKIDKICSKNLELCE
ncbi:MAG: hypothetical protein M1416_03020 [Candidatus Pacearchaeota archaeon]|nr:hypothetical protein [Candidatus Pacearchaeota archaeon]